MNNNLEKNFKALDKISGSEFISGCIKNSIDLTWLKLFNNESGEQNFSIYTSGGDVPAYPTTGLTEDIKKNTVNLSLNETDITLMIGSGLGHTLNEILQKKHKDHIIVLTEPLWNMLKLAFNNYDFSEFIEKGTLLINTQGKQEFSNIMSILESVRVNETWNMVFEKYVNYRVADYREMADFVIASLNSIRCNIGTIMSVGDQLADNDISNLPYVLPYRGVIEFKDFYKDKPAVLVSTGPSLIKNIHFLKDIQDKVIIIAVAQALRPLLAYDITPDFITSVDFGEPNMGHLKGLMDSEVPLVCLNRTYAPLVREYKGTKIIVATPMPGYEKTAAGILSCKGTLDQGGSVAHMSLGLAYHLGCNPIMIIGQDLSLGKTSHIPLADVAGKVEIGPNNEILWEVKDQRSKLSQGQVKHSMGDVRMVPGFFYDMVPTNMGLESFINAFEVLVEKYKDRNIINCTEGGAHIKGTNRTSLKKSLNEFCIDKIDKDKIKPLLSDAENKNELISNTIPLLKTDISNLKTIIKNCNLGIFSSKKIKDAIESKKIYENKLKAINYWSKKNYDQSVKAFNSTVANPLVSVAIYSASRHIQSHAVNKKLEDGKNLLEQKDILLKRSDRNVYILSAAKKASEKLLISYKETLKLLEQYNITKDISILRNCKIEEISLHDAEEYFKNDNYAHPYVDAINILKKDSTNQEAIKVRNKAIEMRDNKIKEMQMFDKTDYNLIYSQLIEKSQKCGQKKDYQGALEALQEADKMSPGQETVNWGLATTAFFLRKFEEAAEYYKKLLTMAPDNYKYKFEYGQVLLNIGNLSEGLKYTSEGMKDTQEYNYFFQRIGDIFFGIRMIPEAIDAYKEYIKYFPLSKEVHKKLIDCYSETQDQEGINIYTTKLEELVSNESIKIQK